MNYLLLIAGIIALSAVAGHFTMGVKDFLNPVLKSDIDITPIKVMHSLFHYMSVFMILTAVILLSFSFNENLFFANQNDVLMFISLTYAGFALSQFLIALNSGIKMGVFKLFQWVIWLLISLFSFLAII